MGPGTIRYGCRENFILGWGGHSWCRRLSGTSVSSCLIHVAFVSCHGLRRMLFQGFRRETGESSDVILLESSGEGSYGWAKKGGIRKLDHFCQFGGKRN